jgi:C1A family cysteine protease/Leucine-rich repeat (LRR) protein
MNAAHRRAAASMAFVSLALSASLVAQIPGGTGLAHTPYKSRPTFKSAKPVLVAAEQTLPSRFDLREQRRLTPVGDQGQIGTCWAFAAIGALESNLAVALDMKADAFSEQNLRNRHGFAKPGSEGGNSNMALAYLARWSGPVPESFDPYTDDEKKTKSPAPTPGLVRVRLLDGDIIPDKDYAAIKRAIMANGAMYSSLDVGDSASASGEPGMEAYFNEKTSAFYKPESSGGNHAIAIAGWDDAFPKSKFKAVNGKRPSRDGAFIVRNSWGADWGDKGYFYVSYEDAAIGIENMSFVADVSSRYNRIYQYDSHGLIDGLDIGGSEGAYALRFSAEADEDLQAVGVFLGSENVECAVSAGASLAAASQAAPLAKARPRWPGYHSISFDKAYPIAKGADFWVVVRMRGEAGTMCVPIETKADGFVTKIALAQNACFAALDGRKFQDLGTARKANIPFKAFATARSSAAAVKVSRVAFEESLVSMSVGETRRFKVEVMPENAADRSVAFAVDKAQAKLVTLGKDGEVTALAAGELDLVALSSDKSVADRCRIVISAASPTAPAFDDPELERAVRKSVGKLSGPLSAADLAGVKALRLQGRPRSLASAALLPGLESLDLSEAEAPVDLAPLARLKSLRSLSIAGLPYADLGPIGSIASLESLDVSGTKASSLGPLASLKRLSTLVASGLKSPPLAPLASLAALRRLDLRDDGIKDVAPLARLASLEELYLSGNSIVDYSPLAAIYPKLSKRDFETGGFKAAFADPRLAQAVRKALSLAKGAEIPKDRLARIRSLDLSDYEGAKDFSLAGIEALLGLDELFASGLGIVDASPLAALSKLECLDLSGNRIADIRFAAGLARLVSLDLSDNRISDLAPLASLRKLEELYLGGNEIADISPLAGLRNLAELELDRNRISSLKPLAKLGDLELLDASSNKIDDLAPVAKLAGLSALFLRDNPAKDFSKLASLWEGLGEYDFEPDGTTFDPDDYDFGDEEIAVDEEGGDELFSDDGDYDYQDEGSLGDDDEWQDDDEYED